MAKVDLHLHSQHSDGTRTPKQIVDLAIERGIGLIAITDHDVMAGSRELAQLCEGKPIRYLPGVEHTTLHDGLCLHILGYCTDFTEPEYLALTRHARKVKDDMSIDLIRKMEKDYPDRISVDDFLRFERDKTRGGWAGIDYLEKRGLAETMMDARHFYHDYSIHYHLCDFPTAGQMIHAIHKAGGFAILAHPGKSIPDDRLIPVIDELIALNLDGIECHYPKQSDWVTRTCIDICNDRNLLITTGSDCHGGFSGAELGSLGIDEDTLRLHLPQE